MGIGSEVDCLFRMFLTIATFDNIFVWQYLEWPAINYRTSSTFMICGYIVYETDGRRRGPAWDRHAAAAVVYVGEQ